MGAIARAHAALVNALMVLSCIIVAAIFVLIVLDVLLPLVGVQPWAGTLGVVEYGLLWFTVLSAPWLARVKGHVYIDALIVLLPPVARSVVTRIAYLVAICGALLLAYYAGNLMVEAYQWQAIDERSIELMLWWIYAPMTVGFVLVAIEFLRYLLGFDDMYGDRTDVKEGM